MKTMNDAAKGRRYGALFVTAVGTGLCQGEILGLQWPSAIGSNHFAELDGFEEGLDREGEPARTARRLDRRPYRSRSTPTRTTSPVRMMLPGLAAPRRAGLA
jgi:hypothetical protein